MAISISLAWYIGVLLVVCGLAVLTNPKRIKRMAESFFEDSGVVMLAGSIDLLLGLIIVKMHNIWEADWRIFITLVGWAALLEGVALFLCPQSYGNFVKGFVQKKGVSRMVICGVICLGIGFLLLVKGW